MGEMVRTRRRIAVISIISVLIVNTMLIMDYYQLSTNATGNGFPQDIFIEVHRVMQIDEVDPGSGADWYFYVGIDEGSGYSWKRSSIPYKDNLDHLVISKVFNFLISTSPVLVAIRLCEDDLWGDDLADISSYPGEGRDDSTSYRRGATCVVSYDIHTHTWSGDVEGSTSVGYSETNGEWDGSYGGDTNDASLWFTIWDDMRVEITHPIFTVPLIQPKSEEFEINVHLDNINPPSSWSGTIFTEYDSYSLQIISTKQVDSYNWILRGRAPNDVRCDLYDLKVEVDGVWDIQEHALSFIDSFSDDLKFLHITDLHIDDPDVEYTGGLGDNVDEANILSSVIKEINLIDPDFVIASGDIGDNPEMVGQNEVRQYERVMETLLKLRVPVYVVNGNHDYDSDSDEGSASIKEYRDIVNPYRDFSFDYGEYHFVGLDSGEKDAYYGLPGCMMGKGLTNSQINWLTSDLINTNAQMSFVFMHHTALDPDRCPEFPYFNSSISKNQMEFLELCRQNDVAMVLTGHTHIDEVWDRDGQMQSGNRIGSPDFPLYIQTKSVTHDDLHGEHGYRLIRVSGGSVSDYSYDGDGNGYRDRESSIVAGDLTFSFSPNNDGTNRMVTSTIVNNLNEDFHDARLIFKMPKPEQGLSYYAIGGEIEQIIPQDIHDIYYVRTNIHKDSTKEVILRQGYAFDLVEGWNLISLPLVQTETDLERVISSIQGLYDSVQWFDSDDPVDPWKHNHNEKLFGNDLNQINEKKGIWVHVTNPGVTEFVCYGNKPTINPEITINPGWNLVGYPSLTANQRSLGLNDLNFGIDIDAIQWYDSQTSSWHFMGPDNPFIPGRGYWIHSKIDSIWEVPQ